jgi:hypothetical protein
MKGPLDIPVTIVRGGHFPNLGRRRSAHRASSAHAVTARIECVAAAAPAARRARVG